jgi:hypothetical protein
MILSSERGLFDCWVAMVFELSNCVCRETNAEEGAGGLLNPFELC